MKLQTEVINYLKELEQEEGSLAGKVFFELNSLEIEDEELMTWDVDNMDNFVSEVRAFYKL